MAIKEVHVDRELCIGAASCVAVAPEVFELDDENKAIVKDKNGVDEQTLLDAAKSCPTNAIILKDENGKQVWPEA